MNKSTLGVIVGVLVLLTFSIYWFGVRPGQVRKDCWVTSQEKASRVIANESNLEERGYAFAKKADYEKVRDDSYKSCLLEHGLAR